MGARPHDLINNLGGSIGYGTPPVATGCVARLSRSARPSAWSATAVRCTRSSRCGPRRARGSPVTTIIFANNQYAILKAEYSNMGAGDAPGRAGDGDDRYRPADDRLVSRWPSRWASPAVSGRTPPKDLHDGDRCARSPQPGPSLIEVKLVLTEGQHGGHSDTDVLTLRTNLAGLSGVEGDPRGPGLLRSRHARHLRTPAQAHNAFKAMLRENALRLRASWRL